MGPTNHSRSGKKFFGIEIRPSRYFYRRILVGVINDEDRTNLLSEIIYYND